MRSLFAYALLTLAVLGMSDAYADRGGGGDGGKGPGFNRAKCEKSANSTRNSCIRTCQNSFKDANKLCQAKDLFTKQCMDACFGVRDVCVTDAKKPLTDCMTAANDALAAALLLCDPLTDPAAKYTCQNNARLDADAARLSCQAAFKANAEAQAALSACLSNASTCVKSCKSVPTPTPTPAG